MKFIFGSHWFDLLPIFKYLIKESISKEKIEFLIV